MWKGLLFVTEWPVAPMCWGLRMFLVCRTSVLTPRERQVNWEELITLVHNDVKLKEIQPKFLWQQIVRNGPNC